MLQLLIAKGYILYPLQNYLSAHWKCFISHTYLRKPPLLMIRFIAPTKETVFVQLNMLHYLYPSAPKIQIFDPSVYLPLLSVINLIYPFFLSWAVTAISWLSTAFKRIIETG